MLLFSLVGGSAFALNRGTLVGGPRKVVDSCRAPSPGCSFGEDFFALPPAARRDLSIEAAAAASYNAQQEFLDAAPAEPAKPLLLLEVTEGLADGLHHVHTLIAEQIQDIAEGARAGSSWIRPLALRREVDAAGGGAAALHVFSAAAPTAFVPTDLLRAVPLRDALEARMAWEAHARDGADDGDDQRDADKMRQLISLLSW